MNHFLEGADKKVVTVLEQQVWYLEKGDGVPILILTGWGGPTDKYLPIQEKLVEIGYRVYLPDLPGLPGKTSGTYIKLSEWESWVEKFSEAAIGERFFILSHSLSAQIALQYILRRDSKCDGAILLSPWLASSAFQRGFWRSVAKGVRCFCPLIFPEMKWVRDKNAWRTALELISIVDRQMKLACLILWGKRDPAKYFLGGWEKVGCASKTYNWDHSPQIRATDELALVIDEFFRSLMVQNSR